MENFNKEGYSDIKIAHVPVIMNIGLEGITNTELSKRLKISRQAMSKTIRELQHLNYIIVKPSEKDKRSLLLFLSDRGMKMVVTAKKRVNKLTNTYKERVGDKKFDQTVSVLLDLLELHSNL
jgi:DNA-binding MarR family transcriptional regulator